MKGKSNTATKLQIGFKVLIGGLIPVAVWLLIFQLCLSLLTGRQQSIVWHYGQVMINTGYDDRFKVDLRPRGCVAR